MPEPELPTLLPSAETRPAADDLPPGWHHALPERIPRQTYTPAILAAGIVLVLWGFVTSVILTGAGIGLLGFGVVGWIGELEGEER